MLEHSWFKEVSLLLVNGKFEVAEKPVYRLFHIEHHHELSKSLQVRGSEQFSDEAEFREFQHGPVRMQSVLFSDVMSYRPDKSEGGVDVVFQLNVVVRDVNGIREQQ